MSLWRKRGTSDTVATDVHHNEQKHDNLVNILPNLSIQSEDLSIRREKAMREVQRLGQEIEQEPVGKFAKFTDGIWREVTDGSAGVSLYTTPPQRKPLTDEMIVAGGKALAKRHADSCGLDFDDVWKYYAGEHKDDAKAAIEAAHGIKE